MRTTSQRRPIDHFNRRCDLGIALGREHWGRGFGQEAARTLVDYRSSI